MKLLKNIPKLIGIMYCAIIVKNVFQLIFGYFSNSESDIKIYKLYNLQASNYSYNFLIQLIFIYDFILLAFTVYIFLYLILYLTIEAFGNKLWLQILYIFIIYIITIIIFNQGGFNNLFIIITILLGGVNWFLFKKYIK